MSWCRTKKAMELLNIDPGSILVFDLETTSRNPNFASILQISIVDGYGNTVFTSLVKPKSKKTWDNVDIHGITPEMVKDAPHFEDIRDEVQTIFDQAKMIAGYNINSYDIKIIERERYKIRVPSNRFDVLEEYQQYFGKRVSLIKCAAHYNYSYTAHDATEDARVTALCMQRLIHEDGFVDYGIKKSKKRKPSIKEPSICEIEEPLGNRERADIPIRKKHKFHPGVFGFVLTAMSFGILGFLTNGISFFLNFKMPDIFRAIETIYMGDVNRVLGATLLIGILFLLYGILHSFYIMISRIRLLLK